MNKVSSSTFTNKLLTLWLIAFIGFSHNAQAQYWVQKGGGVTIDEAYDISVANNSDSYTVGYFTGTATFGSVTLTSSGSTDIYVTKTDNQGNFLWAVKAGGTGSDRGVSIKTTTVGTSYVTGYFSGTATFGSTTLTSSGAQDIFIAKYSATGALLWAVKAGGTDSDLGFGVSYNSFGDVFITGSFKGSATFGSTTLTATNSSSDVFIAKLNSSGVFQWAKSGTGNFSNGGVGINCDSSGNVYVTGRFSDTITFDNMHPNQMQNVIFVVKYNSAGTELWFRIVGGGITNTVYSIAVDNVGLCWITGDFTGSLTFYGTSNVTLTNPYVNKIFVAKYDSSGTIVWTHASGSDNAITSRSINLNNSGSCWISGFFSCKLNQYADEYGQGTFNSVGGSDIFVTKLHSSGNWAYSRNMGGRGEDKAFGVAVNPSGAIYVAGSFNNNLFVRTSANFFPNNLALLSDVSCTGNTPYCSDFEYGQYHSLASSGNLDAVIGRCFDKNREPFDYYLRDGVVSNCQKPQTGVCIDSLCPDTVSICNQAILTAVSPYCSGIGPSTTYSWSSGGLPILPNQFQVTASGTYFVTQTSSDGCFSSEDSIYVNILPPPVTPTISDDHGFNTNNITTVDIEACNPDTVTISGSGFDPTLPYWWTGGSLPSGGLFDSVFTTSTNGTYIFHVIGANGCENSNLVNLTFYNSFPPFPLKMFLEDSVTVCDSSSFTVQLYDSIDNPNILSICIFDTAYSIITTWTISPATPVITSCGTFAFITPPVSGWYDVTAQFVRINFCYSDTIVLTKSVYVTVTPAPYIPPFTITITGGPFLCPGDTIQVVATGAPNYTWLGPNVNGVTDSIIDVSVSGTYTVGSIVFDTNAFGCTASFNTVSQIFIYDKPQPNVTSSSAVICPGDSVLLTSSANAGNVWEGPNGTIADTNSTIYVTDPGLYFTVVNDSDSCGLVSNTILLVQYTTPMLVATGDTFICDGDSTIISIQAAPNSLVEWQAPLSGSSLSQVIYAPGTYTVKITSCGIETYASITISTSSVLATITPSGVLCEDSTITLSALPGMTSYLWLPGGQTTSSIPVNSSGVFTVAVVDSNGCMATSDTFTVDQIFVPSSITTTAQGFCFGDSLTLMGNPGMVSYEWNPTGETSQNIVTTVGGTFILSVTDTNGCVGVSNSIEILVPDTIAAINLLGVDYFCEGDSVVLDAESPIISTYQWYPGNEQSSSITVYQSGIYAVATVDTFGCNAYSDTVSIKVDSNTLIVPTVSNDTSICSGSTVLLVATADSGNIVWYNPLGDPPVYTGSNYSVMLTDNTTFYVRSESAVCASDLAGVYVETFNCDNANVANIFTPNGDGENDYFQIQIYGTTYFKVEIYNRWGTVIYILDHPNQRWDGTTYETGEDLPDGTYYFVATYGKYDGTDESIKGYITLIR